MYSMEVAELNKELALQIAKSNKRAAELAAVNKELAFHNQEKEDRAAELLIANAELAYQNQEKEDRAAELIIANRELAFQNTQKEIRASELYTANKELAFQNQEKEDRAAELLIANAELAYQNQEKENRASELLIANKELTYQNAEKEDRAAELIIANNELAFQNVEKEKREIELLQANRDLETFAFISSHDLQEPLRKIQIFASRIKEEESENLTEKGKYYFERIHSSAVRMQSLINDLLAHSRSTESERNLEKIDFRFCIDEVISELKENWQQDEIRISISETDFITVIPFQFRQLLQNLISNAVKFKRHDEVLEIKISCKIAESSAIIFRNLPNKIAYSHIVISDNGIGFNNEHKEMIFEIFRRLNDNNLYSGTGIGLTIVQKIVDNHKGFIFANGSEGEGATFNLFLPFIPEICNEKMDGK